MIVPVSTRGVVTVDELGSHFVLDPPSNGELAAELGRVPHASVVGPDETWFFPALPTAAAGLRLLLSACPGIELDAEASALMRRVEELPATAEAVAHRCEHRPGRDGVVIATVPGPRVRQALSTLPRVRHDPRLDRWWIPAEREPLSALGRLIRAVPTIAATSEVSNRLESFLQLPLSPEAAADIEHRCSASVVTSRDGNKWLRLCPRCNPSLDERLGDGAEVRRSLQSWSVLIDGRSGDLLREFLRERPEQTGGDATLPDVVRRLADEARFADELERLSASSEGHAVVDGLTGSLRPFQGAAVEYALRARRAFFADEPGLGKTIQALASLEASASFPAVVVCPASLRLNWLRECERWLPERTARIVDSNGAAPRADVRILSYNALHEFVDGLVAKPPTALVLDESHFCKNGSARRTQAALEVARSLDADAMVLLLTGTPVINTPNELGPQLELLGRAEAVSGNAGDPRTSLRRLGPQVLNRRLRRTCFVRRRKSDVLAQLPAKQRVVVPLTIDNRDEYSAVQDDVVRWVRSHAEADARFEAALADLPADERQQAIRARGREAEQRARRAEALVRVNKLALVAARGKLAGALEWIGGFVEGEKLVVFTRHLEIGDRLRAEFPDAALATGRLGPQQRDAELARFQEDPSCRLVICSIDAAGVGVTLTAASNVAFVEMAWTSAAHDQAEDRLHRIGQRSSVTAWYLLAAKTIDERLAAAVERKRSLARGAIDGLADEGSESLGDILDWISEQPPAP